MNYLELIAVLFGATGFWKLVEMIVKFRADKRKQSAEIRNLNAQTEKHVVDNWMQWAQALEKRVKELEAVAEENHELKRQIESQRDRIVELESKVENVERENLQLHNQLKELSKTHDNHE
jgi:septal ring factor EnvC (AmiA/AmiB activator)